MFDTNALAPAILNTDAPAPGVTKKYTFVPTLPILERLTREGFEIVSATQGQRSNLNPFSRHRVELRHASFDTFEVTPGDSVQMRIIMFNSHDRSARFCLHAGAFRAVCANGCVFGESDSTRANTIRFKHSGLIDDSFIEGVWTVVDDAKAQLDTMRTMSQRVLTYDESHDLAERALTLRWSKYQPITPEEVLRPRRAADVGQSLWLTYQRIQENLVRGGMRGVASTQRRIGITGLRSVNANRKVNVGLWDLATQYLEAA